MLNGAQVIVDYLIQEKVPKVFGLCGHGNIQFIDALYERSATSRRFPCTTKASRASWPTSITGCRGKPTATFTSCGPGSANSADFARQCLSRFGAVHGGDRQRSDQPVQSRRVPGTVPALSGRLSLRPCAAYCKKVFQPTRGEMVPLAVRQAWKTMVTGRPGPVVLDVPFDVFMEAAAEEAPNAAGLERQHIEPLRRRSRKA